MSPQGSLAYTRDRLVKLKDSITSAISSLGGHLGLSRLIEGLDRQLDGLNVAATPPSSDKGRGGETASGSISTSSGEGQAPFTLESL